MGKLIKLKQTIFLSIDNKVCSFDGTKNIVHIITADKQAAAEFCKKANANKDIIK